MATTDVSGLTQLGSTAQAPQNPDEAILEKVPTENGSMDYVVRFVCPEFTSLCPMTGQPDFAHIVIRNHGAFHEDCTMEIAKRLTALLSPKWFRIGAYWYPRGGIPIDVFWQSGKAPEHVWVPDQGVPSYRGRG